jgi:pimeloyl-ACP methyl ester carboxylesterase
MKKIFTFIISLIVLGIIVFFAGANHLKNNAASIILKKERTYNKVLTEVPFTQEFIKNSQDQWIDMWWLPHDTSDKVIIYLHGDSGRFIQFFPDLSQKHSVLAPSYPSMAFSEGPATHDMVLETGVIAVEWLLDQGYEEQDIIIWSHSFGGAVATHTAAQYPDLQKLILVNVFSNAQSMCQRFYGALCYQMSDVFASTTYAQNVTVPVRQFHVLTDAVVPYVEGQILFNAFASSDKQFIDLDLRTHSSFDISYTLSQ